MSKPYPKEFRDDVVRVARSRESGVGLDQIANDFGVHFTTLYSWMKKADIEDRERPGATAVQSAELREAKRRIRTCSKRSRSCAPLRPTSLRRICRENELPARP